ncbi:MAG: argininosuccinate synthase [Methanomicrobiales archaeon]|nr:argininosuccinate synthase [Methanomicrobiales archaeon]
MRTLIVALLLSALLAVPVFAAPTTELTVLAIAPNGTVIAERTVQYQWMEANLPVLGDGVTHYYQQGPVFTDDKEARWDANETTNFKDRGAVKCTDLADLAGLVGGLSPGDDVMVHAADGYHVEFGYPTVATPDPRQGPVGICWYNAEETDQGERQGVGYPPDYHVGMRLVFFADTSTNPEGKHVFGNTDMRAVMPPEAVHLFDDLYPSTSGYGVKWIDEIRVYQGGYTGVRNAVVKSLTGSDAVDTTPAATKGIPSIPVAPFLPVAALAGAALFSRRR